MNGSSSRDSVRSRGENSSMMGRTSFIDFMFEKFWKNITHGSRIRPISRNSVTFSFLIAFRFFLLTLPHSSGAYVRSTCKYYPSDSVVSLLWSQIAINRQTCKNTNLKWNEVHMQSTSHLENVLDTKDQNKAKWTRKWKGMSLGVVYTRHFLVLRVLLLPYSPSVAESAATAAPKS